MEMLYANIGGKIKKLAFFGFVIGSIISTIYGLIMIIDVFFNSRSSYDAVRILIGIIVIVLGILSSYISSWLLYGFGELIENSSIQVEDGAVKAKTLHHIARTLSNIEHNQHAAVNASASSTNSQPISSEEREFAAYVDNAALAELQRIAATFDGPDCRLARWQKEYIYLKIDQLLRN